MVRKAVKWMVPWFAGCLVFLLAQLVFAPPASALLYSWPTTVTDDKGDTAVKQKDILSASHAFDGSFHYFRIDMLREPRWKAAETYGFFIDSKAGGADPTGSNLISGGLSGIDFIVSTDYSITGVPGARTLTTNPAFKQWAGTDFTGITDGGLAFLQSERVLEWKINKNYFDSPFTFWAASLKPGNSPATTYDLTSNAVTTPIPGAAWLFATGVLALAGLKRKTTPAS
ncbi:MAG: hypothetical protein A2Z40_00270 [Deltaproteobacteria bacterium RBG_19FT_COMBO_60_16]|nr:MAG: hypothetical protein A2Z13_08220 [Deltaproteobacteria bacterium RBG_16_64_85]OGQ00890.1 MAG: hypothetical protein A2Z40_00270 [Deltaproteobacteria bacterium RBG_19FT_COMBO_60_16]